MKDFIKWLGVNEKVAKVAVWLLIVMICLIVINTCLKSIGLPHYTITYDNLININLNKLAISILEYIICILNFYTIVLLVFRLKEAKPIFKYTIIYIILNGLIYEIFGYIASQVFIIMYIIMFCYLYSKRNWKYIIYSIISLFINLITQGIWYSVKANLIDYNSISNMARTILSIDYFIIMAVIILVKEIYLKKRGVKNA